MIAPIETGKVSVSLQRLRYLERDSEECGELKRQLSEVKRERDLLKQQLAEANAAFAKMRQVLEATFKTCRAAREALHGVIGLIDESRGVVGWHLSGNEAPWSEFNYPTELVEVVEQINKCLPEEEAERA